jgi:hypothetical protein
MKIRDLVNFDMLFPNMQRKIYLRDLVFEQSKNTLHAHIIPNIVKISLKRVEMNVCPGSKIQLMEKPQDMTELSTNAVLTTYLICCQGLDYIVTFY